MTRWHIRPMTQPLSNSKITPHLQSTSTPQRLHNFYQLLKNRSERSCGAGVEWVRCDWNWAKCGHRHRTMRGYYHTGQTADCSAVYLCMCVRMCICKYVCIYRTHGYMFMSAMVYFVATCKRQGCSLGLERLGLEAVSRRFLERLVSSRS